MVQNRKRRERNFPVRSEFKSLIKREKTLIKEGKLEDAVKFLPKVYAIIDKAVKKNIIHKNNGARKKSSLTKMLNELQAKA